MLGFHYVRVRVVLDRWFGRGYRYFKLLGEDGSIYILRHEEGSDVWEMTFFERSSQAMPDSAVRRNRSATARPQLMR